MEWFESEGAQTVVDPGKRERGGGNGKCLIFYKVIFNLCIFKKIFYFRVLPQSSQILARYGGSYQCWKDRRLIITFLWVFRFWISINAIKSYDYFSNYDIFSQKWPFFFQKWLVFSQKSLFFSQSNVILHVSQPCIHLLSTTTNTLKIKEDNWHKWKILEDTKNIWEPCPSPYYFF